eukprot:g5026.t1
MRRVSVGRFVSDFRHVVNKARKSVNENILGPSVNGLVKELEEDERFEDDLEASIQRRLVEQAAAKNKKKSTSRNRLENARELDATLNHSRRRSSGSSVSSYNESDSSSN